MRWEEARPWARGTGLPDAVDRKRLIQPAAREQTDDVLRARHDDPALAAESDRAPPVVTDIAHHEDAVIGEGVVELSGSVLAGARRNRQRSGDNRRGAPDPQEEPAPARHPLKTSWKPA